MQILMVIHASLPTIAEDAVLWAIRVPNGDVAVITGVTTPSLGNLGVNLQGSRAHVGIPAPCQITTDFLHPQALPAECLSASGEDSTSWAEVESSYSESSEREPDEVCPLYLISRM